MASKTSNDEIIDPNGLDLFRLTMMVITASICGGIFSLAGDMAAGGANTGAVIVSWGICFIGVFALMMVFNGLSQARPDLTGGIYAYAAAGFGDYIGFNSAWGYWISACLSNVSFALLLFSALGYFFPAFGAGNNLLSIVCASVFLWFLTALVLRGVKEAAGINTIVTLAKLVPLGLFVLSIVLLGKFNVDMSGEWEVWDYAEVIRKHYGIDVYNTTIEEVAAKLKEYNLEVEKTDSIPRSIDKLWKNIRKDVAGPVWLVNTPKFISPLSKTNPDNPETVERFQPVIAGSELGNGFSELNDPIDQLNRFLEQQQMRDAGDEEAMMLDIDYVEMLEYGMPPACGWGYSERVFWIFEGVTAREGVPFPQLKSEIDETTRAIYPQVNL